MSFSAEEARVAIFTLNRPECNAVTSHFVAVSFFACSSCVHVG